MTPLGNIMVLSSAFTLLASFHAVSDEAGRHESAPLINDMAVALEDGKTIAVQGGRVTSLVPAGPGTAEIRILAQPDHGHVSVNPDNTIALVLSNTDHVGDLSFRYEIRPPDEPAVQRDAVLDVIQSPQESLWGTGITHYMLPVDAANRVVVEHGEVHRKLYVSGNGLTAADIAARHWGVAEDDVTAHWLQENPEYGASEDLALHTGLGFSLWGQINGFRILSSHWLLLERGHDYNVGRGDDSKGHLFIRQMRGESPLHPIVIKSFGEGHAPRITSRVSMSQRHSRNVVVKDIEFTGGVRLLGRHENVLFEGSSFGNGTSGVGSQGHGGKTIQGFTLRNSIVKDAYRPTPTPSGVTDDGRWHPRSNRVAGLFTTETTGILFDGVIFDQNGWAPDFAPDGSVEGGHPPSMFSHNSYAQDSTRDVTMRNSITMRSASYGAQFRGGAFLEDNLYLDNNIPFNVSGGNYKNRGHVGNYSLVNGNVVTSAAERGRRVAQIGALDWGIRNGALQTSLIDNIVAHANDPEDATEIRGGNPLVNSMGEDGIFVDNTIIWRWGRKEDRTNNVHGIDPAILNATTIQRYTADLLDKPTATIDDFGRYLRSLDGAQYKVAVQEALAYFRTGFGVPQRARDTATTLRFVPDPRGDGVRWDNRLNWDSGDLPGTVAADSVDLGGNKVVFGGTVTLDDLTFGPDGGLALTHGRLQVTGDLAGGIGATIEIDRAGQFWAGTTTGTAPLGITVKGGRFVNAGTFGSPAMLTATGGQTILATGGSEFRVDAQSRLHVNGADARIGFDGDDDGTAILRLKPGATLAFSASPDGVSMIKEFRSGAFGASPAVMSGIDLGGASIELDLNDHATIEPLILIDVDEIVGGVETVTARGLGDRDASVVINYRSDMVSVQLSAGTGQISVSDIGTEDIIDPGHAEVWNRLKTHAE